MAISSTARLHIAYQSAIIAILLWKIWLDSLLLVMYAVFVPLLIYQLLIFLWWKELVPLPAWMADQPAAAIEGEVTIEGEDGKTDASKLQSQDKKANEVTTTDPRPKVTRSNSFGTRTYKFRNWRSVDRTSSTLPATLEESRTACPDFKRWTYGTNQSQEPSANQESTKTYFFPHRQKRCEEWLQDQPCRPTKIRSPTSPLMSLSRPNLADPGEVLETIPDLHSSGNSDEVESELTKCYSFPFRQKRFQDWLDREESILEKLNEGLRTPMWPKTDDQPLETANETVMSKRSMSVSQLKDKATEVEDKERDFSQSVEIASDVSKFSGSRVESRKGLFKMGSNSSVNKITRGISNYFSKAKRSDQVPRKRSIKNFFRSRQAMRENVDTPRSFASNARMSNSSDNTYVSFDKDCFENNNHKQIAELGLI